MFRWISARELSFDFLRYFPCLIHLSFYRCFADLIHLFGFVISILLFIMPFILISLIQPFFPIALHPSSFYFIHSSALFLLRCTFVPLVSFIYLPSSHSAQPAFSCCCLYFFLFTIRLPLFYCLSYLPHLFRSAIFPHCPIHSFAFIHSITPFFLLLCTVFPLFLFVLLPSRPTILHAQKNRFSPEPSKKGR